MTNRERVPVYETLTEAISDLRSRGYNIDFNLQENCLICRQEKFSMDEFEVVEIHRFEANTDPADEAVVYAIASERGGKGILVTGYGVTAGGFSAEMAQKLSVKKS